MIITIDGPSGTGKTTVASRVAHRLHFSYFDTGAMYRAFTWFVLQHHVDPLDKEGIKQLLERFAFTVSEEGGEKRYYVGDQEVTEVIRSQLVTDHASVISALKEVRSHLLTIQQAFGQGRDAVFEGRDLGTVVFPRAEVKIFLTADPSIRAERRLNEMIATRPTEALSQDAVLASLLKRDEIDSTREVAPLKCPDDALQIDTSVLSIDAVVEEIVQYVAQKEPRL